MEDCASSCPSLTFWSILMTFRFARSSAQGGVKRICVLSCGLVCLFQLFSSSAVPDVLEGGTVCMRVPVVAIPCPATERPSLQICRDKASCGAPATGLLGGCNTNAEATVRDAHTWAECKLRPTLPGLHCVTVPDRLCGHVEVPRFIRPEDSPSGKATCGWRDKIDPATQQRVELRATSCRGSMNGMTEEHVPIMDEDGSYENAGLEPESGLHPATFSTFSGDF